MEKFMKMTTGQRLASVDKISKTSPGGVKDRDKAIEFAENMVSFLHSQLHSEMIKYDVVIKNIEVAQKTLSRLKANGNVNLQLSNMVIHLTS
jgi:hypothetical protein